MPTALLDPRGPGSDAPASSRGRLYAAEGDAVRRSRFQFVDLAGSERLGDAHRGQTNAMKAGGEVQAGGGSLRSPWSRVDRSLIFGRPPRCSVVLILIFQRVRWALTFDKDPATWIAR